MSMTKSCPNCNYDNTELLPSAFRSELANLPVQRPRSAVDAVRLALGIGSPFPKRHGEPETLLQKMAPPQKISYYPILACWFITTLGVTLVPTIVGTLVGYAALIVAAFVLNRAYRFNINRWPLLFEKWEHSYLCRKCGKIFQIGTGTGS
jgi:hypothetical protein